MSNSLSWVLGADVWACGLEIGVWDLGFIIYGSFGVFGLGV